MDAQVFDRFRDLIYQHSGIALADEKRELLVGRIRKRLVQLQLQEPLQYLKIIESDLTGQELIVLLDAISTNTTYFYREPEHFQHFSKILKGYRATGKEQVKIWCAASSTGEEPYTLAMLAHECLDRTAQKVRVLATDISTRALNRAIAAEYPVTGVAKLPDHLRQRYFVRSNTAAELCSVHPEIRKLVLFKRLNLVEVPYPLQGPVDVIFCRNVMIYFDLPVRQRVIKELSRLLAPGGYLFLSLSENLLGVEHSLNRFDASVYQKDPGGKR